MDEVSEALERVRKALRLERRTGFQDTAVLGGLEGFIVNMTRDLGAGVEASILERLRHSALDYGQKPEIERQKAVDALERLLDQLDGGSSVQAEQGAHGESSDAGPQADLGRPIRYAKGVGGRRAELLEKLGIRTIEDLLMHLPRRIEDRSQVKRIGQMRSGEEATVQGRVRAVDVIKPRPGLEIVKVAVQDNTGVVVAVWFNQPWIASQLSKGEQVKLFGKAERIYGGLQMSNPVWEGVDHSLLTGRLVPIYPATQGLTPAMLTRLIRDNMRIYRDHIREILPAEIRERHGLMPRSEALRAAHSPQDLEEHACAREALAFEELLLFQIGAALERRASLEEAAPVLDISDETLEDFLAALPFKLTGAQVRALDEIRADLASGHPMNRLLQGEVGSGKTVVAAAGAYIAGQSGAQTVLMAPTEILARQHYGKLKPVLEPLGLQMSLLIGSQSENLKAQARDRIARGEVELVMGTHALLGEDVAFSHLGLVIIDEQHRFGVVQRAELEGKSESPHVLVMSATPIPRTITLTLYGQFEISLIDELPFSRDVRTYWLSEDKRQEVYRLAARELQERRSQAYVVYPLIEDSEELGLRSATQMKEELEETFFKDFRVGLLHGRMGEAEVREVMERIRRRELDVLVSTTIIEVGIDVPDASLMVIEHADRFGLSQLHQLRGRIGRQGQLALCFAVANAKTEEARKRLEAFRDRDDGFEIAEEDLKIRGPGELLGLSQHGLDTTFKVADLIRDLPLMKAARDEAFHLLERDPDSPLIEEFRRRFGDRFELARV